MRAAQKIASNFLEQKRNWKLELWRRSFSFSTWKWRHCQIRNSRNCHSRASVEPESCKQLFQHSTEIPSMTHAWWESIRKIFYRRIVSNIFQLRKLFFAKLHPRLINKKNCCIIKDDEEEFHQKFLCVNTKRLARNACEGESFYFHFMKTRLFLFG